MQVAGASLLDLSGKILLTFCKDLKRIRDG